MTKYAGPLKKILVSICMSVGMLAIANVETIWQEYHHDELREDLSARKSLTIRSRPARRVPLNLKPAGAHVKTGSQQDLFTESLERDEMGDQNPFANLKNLAALQQILAKGVTSFTREAYRSPNYQGESGYDLLSYVIQQADGGRSTILVYMEGVPYVTFAVGTSSKSDVSTYRAGLLQESLELSTADAESHFARRLNVAVPFLSVAR